MLRKIALTGVTAAAIVGVGTAALAASGPSSTAGSGSTGSSHSTQAKQKSDHKHKHNGKMRIQALRRSVHGSIVTKGKDGFVVHSAIRGTVTAVSPTSLTVKAADGFSQTYTLAKTTKVRERVEGKKPTAGTVSDLKTGDEVGVLGRSADKAGAVPTAQVVLDGLKK